MPAAVPSIAFIGFGEAAMAFADGRAGAAIAYDHKTEQAATRTGKLEDYARLSVAAAESNAIAVTGATLVLSLVTAQSALTAAQETAASIEAGALYCDMNSVAPQTKQAAAKAIAAAGGHYVDVAIMAPVHPKRRGVPLLASGPHAANAVAALRAAGFTDVRALDGPVGAASSIKMIRSVMVKGIEALTAECMLAARRAGVVDEVVASLDAGASGDWAARADYNLDRMMVHGVRRAEEMEEVVRTLEALGMSAAMTRGTVEYQRAIGRMALDPGLDLVAKIDAILSARESAAA